MKRPLVVGSVAFDLIFGIHGKIQDEILVEKNGRLGRQNLMFTAKSRESFFGGTGANIAYGLGLLGKKPLLFSLAGSDYEGVFAKHLARSGVETRVVISQNSYTATFYGMSDELGQQIGVYQPNAYGQVHTHSLSETLTKKDFDSIGVAIFSAGTGMSILRHMKETREKCGKDTLIIFDPGQVISVFYDKALLEKTLALADIFIGNEVEIQQLQTILGYSRERLLTRGLRSVIETRGERGSILYEPANFASRTDRHYLRRLKTAHISVVQARKVVETTGAGDAYRAGLIAKLLEGKTLSDACEYGAQIAARSVAFRGAQTYRV